MRLYIASLLTALWATAQAYFLLNLGGQSGSHITGWILFVIGVLNSFSLLARTKWAQALAVICAACMLVFYGWFIYQYIYHFGPPHLFVWIQPALVVAVLLTLVVVPSNPSLKRDRANRPAP